MKLITRDTDYALRALCYIFTHKKKIVSVAELVSTLRIPRPFLRKILQILNKKRILKSYKGKHGGFLAARPANKIFLVDLIETFQGPVRLNECFFKKLSCPQVSTCVLRGKIDKIERYVLKDVR